ncbi:MAG: hypothetical protein V1722_00310 [Candidatus Micrarchaeota archaeon]
MAETKRRLAKPKLPRTLALDEPSEFEKVLDAARYFERHRVFSHSLLTTHPQLAVAIHEAAMRKRIKTAHLLELGKHFFDLSQHEEQIHEILATAENKIVQGKKTPAVFKEMREAISQLHKKHSHPARTWC